jgi:hypothetical protein
MLQRGAWRKASETSRERFAILVTVPEKLHGFLDGIKAATE